MFTILGWTMCCYVEIISDSLKLILRNTHITYPISFNMSSPYYSWEMDDSEINISKSSTSTKYFFFHIFHVSKFKCKFSNFFKRQHCRRNSQNQAWTQSLCFLCYIFCRTYLISIHVCFFQMQKLHLLLKFDWRTPFSDRFKT